MIQLRMLGGAMARVAPDATAFAHRDKPALLSLINGWRNPAESVQRSAWTAHAWHAWRPYTAGAYANFLEDEGEARIHEAYPAATYARLARLKERYDAANVFRLNQNIKPLRGPYALGRPEEWTEGAA